MEKEIEDLEMLAFSLSMSGHHLHADKILEITARLKRYSAQQSAHPTPLQACVCGETKLTVLGLCASCGRERR